MRAGPRIAKIAALSVAIIAHGLIALALVAEEEVLAEGADGATEVRLGNAFADMVAGTLTADRPDVAEKAEAAAPERIEVEEASATAPSEKVSEINADRPGQSAQAGPDRLSAEAAEHAAAVSIIAPVEPLTAESAPPRELASLSPSPSLRSMRPEPLESAPTPERLENSAPESVAVDRSLRPLQRSAAFEAAHKPTPAARPSPTPEPAARPTPPKRGNAERNARAGEANGKAQAKARQSGTDGAQQATGNAAASNYPGLVMRRLSRASRPRINARGAAIVAFTIGSGGAVAQVSLARTSGSSALDKAAVQLVSRSGPFPKPPQGAQRSFSVQIQGR